MIHPIGNRVLVEKDAPKVLKVGSILVPECLEKTTRYAPTVLATVVGVGARVEWAKVGDRVALKDYAGDHYHWDNRTFTLLREQDLVGLAHET
jgi:co-chaperonin GroES (HSP10)